MEEPCAIFRKQMGDAVDLQPPSARTNVQGPAEEAEDAVDVNEKQWFAVGLRHVWRSRDTFIGA